MSCPFVVRCADMRPGTTGHADESPKMLHHAGTACRQHYKMIEGWSTMTTMMTGGDGLWLMIVAALLTMSVGNTDPKVGTNAGECPPCPYKSASCKQQQLNLFFLFLFFLVSKLQRAEVKC